jgi:hypothetical protein
MFILWFRFVVFSTDAGIACASLRSGKAGLPGFCIRVHVFIRGSMPPFDV